MAGRTGREVTQTHDPICPGAGWKGTGWGMQQPGCGLRGSPSSSLWDPVVCLPRGRPDLRSLGPALGEAPGG